MSNKMRLEALLSELTGRLSRVERDLSEPLDTDSSEQAVEMQDDVPLEAQAVLIQSEIASVERALDRIAKGTYGECVQCRQEIATARLDVRPQAALCIKCARAE